MISVGRAFPIVLLAASVLAQQSDSPTFQATAKFVLVPFTVARGKYLAGDLQPSDVTLREDGRPRNFTIFQGPNTPNPLPLEMILLFDSTKNPPSTPQKSVQSHWDAKAAYEFLKSWDEPATRAILDKNGMDIRISVYHYANRQFERLCNATPNPSEILQAFGRLLDPIPAGEGILTLLPGSKDLSDPRLILFSNAWLSESIVAALNDATAAAPNSARRVLIVFSEGYSVTTQPRKNVADAAVALGVPVFPVILDRNKYVEHPFTCNFGRDGGPGSGTIAPPGACPGFPSDRTPYVGMPAASLLGEMTDGGVYFPANLDRKAMDEILQGVRDAQLAEYVVGFVPEPSQAPRKRKLEVVLKSKSVGTVVGGRRDVSY